jgi:hypothetical protein
MGLARAVPDAEELSRLYGEGLAGPANRAHALGIVKKVRQHPILFGALALLVGLGVWWCVANREPEFEGKPYSFWMTKFCFSNGGVETEAVIRRFREMGPEGARYLAGLADFPGDTRGYVRVDAQARSLRQGNSLARLAKVIWGRLVNVPAPNSGMELSPPFIRYRASQAVMLLRPKLEALGPEFIARLKSPNAESRHLAQAMLAALPEAAQYEAQLIEALNTKQDMAQARIVEGICLSANVPPKLLLAAVDAVGKADAVGRGQLMFFLGRVGPSASNAVPVLRAALVKETNVHARYAIAHALWQIAPLQPESQTAMEELLLTPEYMFLAVRSLLSPRPPRPVPPETLLKALSNPEAPLFNGYFSTLSGLLPPKAEAVVVLGPALKSPDIHRRMAAAVLMLQLEANHPESIAVLLEAARTYVTLSPGERGETWLDVRAVLALGELRGAASSAVAELTKMLETAPEARKPALRNAIMKLGPYRE